MIIEGIPLSKVHDYNTNNHWLENKKPIDYDVKLEETYTHHWIDKFHKDYKKIVIDNFCDISWLRAANKFGSVIREFPDHFEEEMDELVQKLERQYPDTFNNHQENSFFVRVENVSLKSGYHGIGPYRNFQDIIESLVTCRRGHSPFDECPTAIHLYIIPWKGTFQHEFRVFVYNGKITAISQQNIYKQIYDNENEVKELCDKIISNFNSTLKRKIEANWIESYVYDVAILIDEIYFIEPNPFGKEYSSGSALFHWIEDEKILYANHDSLPSQIVVRYTI